jgi:hypothetical protein
MATTKRTTRKHATVRRAAGGTNKAAKPTSANAKSANAKSKKTKRVAAKPTASAKPARATKSAASSKTKTISSVKSAASRKPTHVSVADNAQVSALKAKFQRERNALEKRLSEAALEIGILRHHELRAMQLERQLGERDAVISRLQTQLGELERRPAETVYVHEVQQTLALGGSAHALEAAESDLDEFDDERLPDDVDRIGEDD